MFKWIAEYTRRTPWCYVLFEDTNVAWLFPENIDRLVINPSSRFRAIAASADSVPGGEDSGMCTVTMPFPGVKEPVLTYLAHESGHVLNRSRLVKDFDDTFERYFKDALTAERSPTILLSGAPGIGKTWFVTRIFKASLHDTGTLGSVAFVEPPIDGSDDIFTRDALRDVLDQRTKSVIGPVAARKTVLIVDEVGQCKVTERSCCNSLASKLFLLCLFICSSCFVCFLYAVPHDGIIPEEGAAGVVQGQQQEVCHVADFQPLRRARQEPFRVHQ